MLRRLKNEDYSFSDNDDYPTGKISLCLLRVLGGARLEEISLLEKEGLKLKKNKQKKRCGETEWPAFAKATAG